MTKDELQAKVAKQQSIINDANDEICSYVNDYIESLSYKVGDKEDAQAVIDNPNFSTILDVIYKD